MYIIIRLYSHKVLNSQAMWVPFNLMKDSLIHIIHSFKIHRARDFCNFYKGVFVFGIYINSGTILIKSNTRNSMIKE